MIGTIEEKYKRYRVKDIYVIHYNGHIERFYGDEFFIAVDDSGHYHIEKMSSWSRATRMSIRYSYAQESYVRIVRDNRVMFEETKLDIMKFVRPIFTTHPAYDSENMPIYVPMSVLDWEPGIEDDDLPF